MASSSLRESFRTTVEAVGGPCRVRAHAAPRGAPAPKARLKAYEEDEGMRTRVTRSFAFEAAHQLPWHPGKCRRLHGHHYRFEVTVEGPLDENGIVLDFDVLDEVVRREIVERYDHRYLNDLMDNPTAELIAGAAWKQLEAAGLQLAGLRLWETPDSSVELLP
jgi:6-pyruvoyltetrahydropterin/6-carboxytetrahydropterin synthase